MMQAITAPELRTVSVTRYVTPLREGGSLPALVEADDGFLYVLKFRGAGQGIKALIAELVVGELARALGLRMPELVFCELDEAFGRTEPDVIQAVVALVPDEWLTDDAPPAAQRAGYVRFLESRLAASPNFVQEADDARQGLI